jgi:hypothetical protein
VIKIRFEEAIKMMRKGVKVRRPVFDGFISWNDADDDIIHMGHIKADDWEVYRENDKRRK